MVITANHMTDRMTDLMTNLMTYPMTGPMSYNMTDPTNDLMNDPITDQNCESGQFRTLVMFSSISDGFAELSCLCQRLLYCDLLN